MRFKPLAFMAAALALLICPLFTACTSPPGMVSVGAVRPTVEFLAPYTTAGIQNDHTLTDPQKANLLRELEHFRAMLLDAEEGAPAAKAKVGAVASRASPEPPALACIEPTTGVARPGNQYAVRRNQISTQDRPELLEHAWLDSQAVPSRAPWSFRSGFSTG